MLKFVACRRKNRSKTKKKTPRVSPISGVISEEDPFTSKHAQHLPSRDGTGDGVFIREEVFGKDSMVELQMASRAHKLHRQVATLAVRFSSERVRGGPPLGVELAPMR